jgi:4'-phosphopantetheinyl transferase
LKVTRLVEPWVSQLLDYNIEHDGVHVWKSQFQADPAVMRQFTETLSREEIDRARRLVRGSDRDRYIFSHGLLRTILSSYLICDPRQLNFNTNQFGKPFLATPYAESEMRFNLSHSRDMTLIAVSCGIEVGIDIEYMRAIKDARQIANQSFSCHERQILNALPPAELEKTFYSIWVAKEAFLKGIGKGLSYPLDRFSILFSNTTNDGVVYISDGLTDAFPWNVLRLFPGDGYAAALATEVPESNLKFYEYFVCQTGMQKDVIVKSSGRIAQNFLR